MAKNRTQDAAARMEAADQRAMEAYSTLEDARAKLKKANQNYSAALARKEENDAATENAIKARKEKEAEAKAARGTAAPEAQG